MKISTEWKLTFSIVIIIGIIYIVKNSIVNESETIFMDAIKIQEKHISDLRKEIERCRKNVNDLIEENSKLKEDNKELSKKRSLKLRISAYTASVDECDSDPYITANMTKVRPGIVAVSRDLFYEGWSFGKKIYIEGIGIYTIEDLMGKTRRIKGKDRYIKKSMDIFLGTKKQARKFGVKYRKVVLLN